MRYQLLQLGRNLRAGVRLALFLPVGRLAFRFGVAELLVLFLLSAALDIATDWVRYGPDAYFSLHGAGYELFAAGLLLFTAALLALLYRQPSLLVAFCVVALAALPTIQLAHTVPELLARFGPPWIVVPPVLKTLFLAWLVAICVRSVAVATARRRPWVGAVIGGLALVSAVWISPWLTSVETWWKQPAEDAALDPRYPNPASEPVLAAQAELLDQALADLDDERANVPDLYFVAFGGYGREDVFRKDVDAAHKVMEERWDTAGRSVTLVNNPRTLLTTPMATMTNLRQTLSEIAGAINLDEDVVMIYLTSHGTAFPTLDVSMPPLELAPITPAALRDVLDEAGIKWRVIVISSCYSGGFIPALEDEYTLIITAAAADRTSFGCGFRSDGTFFGQAFFGEGMTRADSLLDAFEIGKQAIATRELEARVSQPSNPQISLGPLMADKLKELNRGTTARRAGRSA